MNDFRMPGNDERRYVSDDAALYLDVSSEGLVRLELCGVDSGGLDTVIALSHADTLDLIEQLSAIVGSSRRYDGPTGADFTRGGC